MAFDVCSAAQNEFLAGEDIALDCSVDSCDRHFDHRFRDVSASADNQCPVRRSDIPREVAVNPQHRFEAHFTRKINHVADETEPVVSIDICPVDVDWSGLAAFVFVCNCLSHSRNYNIYDSMKSVTIALPFQDGSTFIRDRRPELI